MVAIIPIFVTGDVSKKTKRVKWQRRTRQHPALNLNPLDDIEEESRLVFLDDETDEQVRDTSAKEPSYLRYNLPLSWKIVKSQEVFQQ